MHYVALMHKDPDSAFGVSFPDLPGCFSAGDTVDEATRNSIQGLAAFVRWLETDGEEVPSPRSPDAILADAALVDDLQGATLILIPLVRDLDETTRINVSIDLGLLQAIDAEAALRQQTRSAFIAAAVRKELQAPAADASRRVA